jgi:hypothetical protein
MCLRSNSMSASRVLSGVILLRSRLFQLNKNVNVVASSELTTACETPFLLLKTACDVNFCHIESLTSAKRDKKLTMIQTSLRYCFFSI